ncbi:MAG: enoyl-CoA hydratase/isomerase family protein [Planctomycetes bacterium]|nr:enoyl-CoA hydratase/isomerase family protein [Planctomycetota bacterium]
MTNLELSVSEGVRRIVLRRPPLNILTIDLMRELASALGAVEAGDRAVILSGAGKHFSAGADVGEHLPPKGSEMMAALDELFRALLSVPVPTLAAVRGACLGAGFELALGCDLIVAAETARFGVPEIRLGVFAPIACALLPDSMAGAIARDLLFTGRELSGKEAGACGLASRIAPEAELDAAAESLARHLGSLSVRALRTCKKGLGSGAADRVSAAIRLYRETTLQSPDAIEGLTAFLEKRSPVWKE